MGKKKSSSTKASAKEAKKAKSAAKVERKEAKAQKKPKGPDAEDDDDNDLEGILETMRIEWEEKHRVTEETAEGPPSRRANATLTADPSGNHLWCIGGEFFSEDGKAHFYNDVYRYTPEKNEWRRYTSATCPGPRSAHAVVATPASGGKLFLFGGEFSSLHQTTFHHYRDLWEFDICSRGWERIETKLKPSARSGHRMALWKHLLVLFGGFYDPGIRTQYLNDLWIFDTQDYVWKQVEMRDADRKPSSGFSFIPTQEGIVLHGGYCKEYVKGKRVQGIALEDTWFLKMSTDTKELKWERRKRSGYAPSIRSGCTMALWANKDIGILFGGVKDDDQSEESLVSEFYNDLYGYHAVGKGRWTSMMLRKAKKPGGSGKQEANPHSQQAPKEQKCNDDSDEDMEMDFRPDRAPIAPDALNSLPSYTEKGTQILPLPRYNALLAVLRNTLYIYGGILERGSREITMDDFWSLALDKMDAFLCLKPLTVDVTSEGNESSSDDDSGDDDGEDDENDSEEEADGNDAGEDGRQEHADPNENGEEPDFDAQLRARATDFLNAANNITPAEAAGTPLPGETLASFYERTRQYWVQQAFATSTNRGKELRRDGFALAEELYASYKPVLKEVEKILEEAGLDADEMKKAASGSVASSSGTSRNRR